MKIKQSIKYLLVAIIVGVIGILVGYGIVSSMHTVLAGDSDVITIHEGASVRLVEGSSGIRFKGEVDKDYIAELEVADNVSEVTYGIVITPKSYLDAVSDFTMKELSDKYVSNPFLKIEAEKIITHDDTYEFRCAMIGLNRGLYAKEFAARSYIEIVYSDGNIDYIYSDFDVNNNVRSVRNVAKAAFADTSQTYADVETAILMEYIAEDVYLSSNGNDANTGTTENTSVATLSKALSYVSENGKIVVCDSYTVPSDFAWVQEGRKITITGASLDFTNTSNIVIGDQVIFNNITLTFKESSNVFANGNGLVIGENVTITNPINLYGGGHQTTVASTNLKVLSGNYYRIFGGSYAGKVTGDSMVYIGGTTNELADPTFHSGTYNIYGGGNNGTVGGNTYLTFTDNAKANYVYGGAYGTGAVSGTNVMFTGGKCMSLTGGNHGTGSISSVTVKVYGGEMQQLFGANEGTSMTGNVVVELVGGTITRRIYGGCYNE